MSFDAMFRRAQRRREEREVKAKERATMDSIVLPEPVRQLTVIPIKKAPRPFYLPRTGKDSRDRASRGSNILDRATEADTAEGSMNGFELMFASMADRAVKRAVDPSKGNEAVRRDFLSQWRSTKECEKAWKSTYPATLYWLKRRLNTLDTELRGRGPKRSRMWKVK